MTHEDRAADPAGPGRGGEGDDATLVRREEELTVGTERVVSGRVRLRKRIVEEQQTFSVTVRREEVEVITDDAREGRSGEEPGGFADADARAGHPSPDRADGANGAFDDGEAELVLYAERPVVTMERVPVERVRLRRVTVAGEETITQDVQRERIDVVEDDIDAPGGDARPRRGDLPSRGDDVPSPRGDLR